MTTRSRVSLEDVAALMEEREKHENYIAALEARRSTTPENVFSRVHADYKQRLQTIVEKLSTHSDLLQEQVEGLARRIAALEGEEQRRRDERAELELRAHVGEIHGSDFAAAIKQIGDALAKLAAERASLTEQHERTRHFLMTSAKRSLRSGATGASDSSAAPAAAPVVAPTSAPPLAPPSIVEPALTTTDLASDEAIAPRPPGTSSAALRAGDHGKSFDELAFLNEVVGPEGAGPGRRTLPAAPQGPARNASGDADPAIVNDPASGLGGAGGAHARVPAPSEFVHDEPVADAMMRDMADRESNPLVPANGTSNRSTGGGPAAEPGQPKTLKCASCGSMNPPTEWYCERCGAELASV